MLFFYVIIILVIIVKVFFKLITIIILFTTMNVQALDIQSNNAILYQTNDNKLLFEKNAEEKVQIASLTKIMTAIVTLENIKDLNEKVVLKSEDFYGIASENLVTAGFMANEKVTYKDLLYGLLIPSGADAAKALARLVGGSEKEFVKKMNAKAEELKLTDTHFGNEIGLDDKDNYSTAKDIASLFQYSLKNEDFKTIITTESYTISNGRFTIKNNIRKNKIVGSYLLGGKTGTTDGAGLCLASIANIDDVNFLLVTLGAPYDKKGKHNFEDASTIYDYYKNNYSYQTIYDKNDVILTLKTKYIKKDEINFKASDKLEVYLPNNIDKNDIKYEYNGIEILTPNIKENQKLGTLSVYYKTELLTKEKIILKEKLQFSLLKVIKTHKIISGFITLFILFIIFIIIKRRKNKKRKQRKKRRL